MIKALHKWNVSFKSPILAFLLSIILTLVAYFIAIEQELSDSIVMSMIIGLAGLQALIQLVLFLHLGIESKPHWNLIIFLFTVLVVVIVIGGSIWIMYSLNYNMMPVMENSKT